jgi:hypothetical protein
MSCNCNCGKNFKPTRFVVEGEWSGYHSRQRRIVHRVVVKRWYAEAIKDLVAIRYTDGTTLDISVRPCKKYEKVKQIKGYSALINVAAFKKCEGVVGVMEL